MSFRAQQIYKKIVQKVGEEWMSPEMKKTLKKKLPDNKIVMSRADRGIFAGKHIQFGNQISEDGGNKSRRNWKPNVQEKRLFSYIYNRFIKIKVTTHALRCIDKAGGIDEYLLKTPYNKMDSEMGVLWKAKMEKRYVEVDKIEGGILSLIQSRRKEKLSPNSAVVVDDDDDDATEKEHDSSEQVKQV